MKIFSRCLAIALTALASLASFTSSADSSEYSTGADYWVDTQRVPIPDEQIAPGVSVVKYLTVNHNGYLPGAPKMMVIRNPVAGNDAGESYSTSGKTYFLVNVRTGEATALTKVTQFTRDSGKRDDTRSGDEGWLVDFSSVTTEGHYYIRELSNNKTTGRSYGFTISNRVYRPLQRAAFRALYYNRACFDKQATASDFNLVGARPWAEAATGTTYRNAVNFDTGSSPRDLCGGWADAGDSNFYPTFMVQTISSGFAAYWLNKELWDSAAGDATGIPESGNGIPDILDEMKWGIDHVLKFQNPNGDGTVISKVGCVGFNCDFRVAPAGQAGLASNETVQRRYYAERRTSAHPNGCSSSIAASALMLSSAAYHFSTSTSAISDSTYINTLRNAATANFNRFNTLDGANQLSSNCTPAPDANTIVVGDPDEVDPLVANGGYTLAQRQRSVVSLASAYLWQLSGGSNSTYRNYTLTNYKYLRAYSVNGPNPSAFFASVGFQGQPFELLRLTMIGMDSTMTSNIQNAISGFLNSTQPAAFVPPTLGSSSAYLYRCRINDYVYNSNTERTSRIIWGAMTKRVSLSGAATSDNSRWTLANACADFMHGTNPQNLMMLTNMAGPPYYIAGSAPVLYHYQWGNAGATFGGSSVPNGGNLFAKYDPANPTAKPGPPPGYVIAGATNDSRIRDTFNVANTFTPPYPSSGGSIDGQPLDKRFRLSGNSVKGDYGYLFTEPGTYWNADYMNAMLLMEPIGVISSTPPPYVAPPPDSTPPPDTTTTDPTPTTPPDTTVTYDWSVSTFSPTSGGAGWTVYINGSNLSGTTGIQVGNSSIVAPIVVYSYQLQFKVPSNATTGPITVYKGTASQATVGTFTMK